MEWAPPQCTCSSVPRMFIPRILQLSYMEPLEVLKRTEKVFSFSNKKNWKQWVEASYFKPSGATDSGYAHLCIQDICWIFIFKKHAFHRPRGIIADITVFKRSFLFVSQKMHWDIYRKTGWTFIQFFFPPDLKYRLYKTVTRHRLTQHPQKTWMVSIKSTAARLSAERWLTDSRLQSGVAISQRQARRGWR